MNDKIDSFETFKKKQIFQKIKTKSKMFFLIFIISIIFGLVIWEVFVENVVKYDVDIPQSLNIKYQDQGIVKIDVIDLEKELINNRSKLNFIYYYTSWCSSCIANFTNINEIAREFQNTELNFMAINVDRDKSEQELMQYFEKYGNIYFKMFHLVNRDGFEEFNKKYDIPYDGRIPLVAIINQDGNLVHSHTGNKSINSIRKKIIENLYLKDDK